MWVGDSSLPSTHKVLLLVDSRIKIDVKINPKFQQKCKEFVCNFRNIGVFVHDWPIWADTDTKNSQYESI